MFWGSKFVAKNTSKEKWLDGNKQESHGDSKYAKIKSSCNLINWWRKSKRKWTIVAEWWSAIPRSRKNIVYHVKNAQDRKVAYRVHDAIYNNYGTLESIYL
jgi:hypothetical protein